MKKLILKPIALLAALLLLINAKNEKKHIDASLIEKSISKISDNLYAGKYEVSNWLYRQFLNDLATNKRTEDLKIAEIDSDGWTGHQKYHEPMVELYHRHPAYEDYPVVNISYEGANLFCTWLTAKYNSLPERKYGKIKFFLPTEQEWMIAANGKSGHLVYATGASLKNKKGQPMANYRRTDIPDSILKSPTHVTSQEYLAPVSSYWENDFGVFNLDGNAAEMISEKGVTKGGSYKNTEEGLKIELRGHYEKSATNVGFRYFMQVTRE